jgi:phospholipid-translocating ATPase
MLALIFFNDSYTNIVTITFTTLILIELLNVYTQITKYTFSMMMMQIATFVTYFMSIVLLKEYFDVSFIDTDFLVKVMAITMITWLPLHILSWIVNVLDPSESQKIMEDIVEEVPSALKLF